MGPYLQLGRPLSWISTDSAPQCIITDVTLTLRLTKNASLTSLCVALQLAIVMKYRRSLCSPRMLYNALSNAIIAYEIQSADKVSGGFQVGRRRLPKRMSLKFCCSPWRSDFTCKTTQKRHAIRTDSCITGQLILVNDFMMDSVFSAPAQRKICQPCCHPLGDQGPQEHRLSPAAEQSQPSKYLVSSSYTSAHVFLSVPFLN